MQRDVIEITGSAVEYFAAGSGRRLLFLDDEPVYGQKRVFWVFFAKTGAWSRCRRRASDSLTCPFGWIASMISPIPLSAYLIGLA